MKNAHYWRKDASGNQLPFLDKVIFKPIPDTKQRLSSRRILSGDIEIPLLCFIQGAQRGFLGIKIEHVLVVTICDAHRAAMERLEYAVPFQILSKSQAFIRRWKIMG